MRLPEPDRHLCSGCAALAAIPVDGSPQAFLEIHLRFVAEMLFRPEMSPGMLDVAAAFLAIENGAGERSKRLKQFERLIQRDPAARRDVEYFAGHLVRGSFAGQQVGFDRILDIGEIPALFAIAENCRLFSVEHLRDELRQHT